MLGDVQWSIMDGYHCQMCSMLSFVYRCFASRTLLLFHRTSFIIMLIKLFIPTLMKHLSLFNVHSKGLCYISNDLRSSSESISTWVIFEFDKNWKNLEFFFVTNIIGLHKRSLGKTDAVSTIFFTFPDLSFQFSKQLKKTDNWYVLK